MADPPEGPAPSEATIHEAYNVLWHTLTRIQWRLSGEVWGAICHDLQAFRQAALRGRAAVGEQAPPLTQDEHERLAYLDSLHRDGSIARDQSQERESLYAKLRRPL